MKKRHIFVAVFTVVSILLTVLGVMIYRDFASIPELFRLNAQLKSEGYYMGEFEFKMIGIVYYLDKGQYITALSMLNQIQQEMESKVGLVKIPRFTDKEDELEFYLGLQNPRTGAFMNDSYPLCTYVGPTFNVVNHLLYLAKEVGRPLRLKYPLRFLDKINTGEKLKAYLDDLSSVGWLASRLPKTPNILAFEIAAYNDIESNNLYTFSPEWKKALLAWFYENQDRQTGFWGPRSRSSGHLLNSGDLAPSCHIARLLVDDRGNDRHPDFPLRHKDEMFVTTLRKLSEPMPENLADQHDWSISRERGIRLLTNILWIGASPENRSNARGLMEEIVRVKFQKFYVQDQGAFSLYAGSTEADLDGTGEGLGLLQTVGALSQERQERLWGPPDKNITDLGVHGVTMLTELDLRIINDSPGINSIRFYVADPSPDGYASNVVTVVYPRNTPVLDIMEFLPKLAGWVNSTPQHMGNYVSKESIIKELANLNIQPAPVAEGDAPLKLLNDVLQENRKLIVIGFDLLQVPRYKASFCLNII